MEDSGGSCGLIPCNWYTSDSGALSFTVINLGLVSSVVQSCPTLCDPMNCITPGLPVHHQLPEFTQTHVHLVSDALFAEFKMLIVTMLMDMGVQVFQVFYF